MRDEIKHIELTGLEKGPARVFWGCHDSLFGPLLLGVTHAGLCRMEFASGFGLAYDLSRWADEWKGVELIPDAGASAQLACQFRSLTPGQWNPSQLALYGTQFQLKVWQAILQIKPGQVMSFNDVATLVGKPGAAKAVSMAACTSPVPLLMPFHRLENSLPLSAPMDAHRRLMMALEDRGYRKAG